MKQFSALHKGRRNFSKTTGNQNLEIANDSIIFLLILLIYLSAIKSIKTLDQLKFICILFTSILTCFIKIESKYMFTILRAQNL